MKFIVKMIALTLFISTTGLFCEQPASPVEGVSARDCSYECQRYGDKLFKKFVNKIKNKIGLKRFRKEYSSKLKFVLVKGEHKILSGKREYKKNLNLYRKLVKTLNINSKKASFRDMIYFIKIYLNQNVKDLETRGTKDIVLWRGYLSNEDKKALDRVYKYAYDRIATD